MQSFSKIEISVAIDSALLNQVDELTGDRSQAVEEALKLWCESKRRPQRPQRPVDIHQQRHNDDETGWLV
jgi:metal-responsive CopG/Arc/MetJ family transcriptional regulator